MDSALQSVMKFIMLEKLEKLKQNKINHGLPEFTSGPPNENFGRPRNVIHSPRCTPCKLFIHEVFFGPLGLHLSVWSELRRSPPFRPMRALRLQWSQAFNLVCEVALTTWKGLCCSKNETIMSVLFVVCSFRNSLVISFYLHKYSYTFKLIKHDYIW